MVVYPSSVLVKQKTSTEIFTQPRLQDDGDRDLLSAESGGQADCAQMPCVREAVRVPESAPQPHPHREQLSAAAAELGQGHGVRC